MDRESIKRKIAELLALSKSTNENEALAAGKTARKLMLKYHISASEEMADIKKTGGLSPKCPQRN